MVGLLTSDACKCVIVCFHTVAHRKIYKINISLHFVLDLLLAFYKCILFFIYFMRAGDWVRYCGCCRDSFKTPSIRSYHKSNGFGFPIKALFAVSFLFRVWYAFSNVCKYLLSITLYLKMDLFHLPCLCFLGMWYSSMGPADLAQNF